MTARFSPDLADALHRSRTLLDAPEALVQQAVAQFQRTPARAAEAGHWRRLVATLGFDSAFDSPAAAVRGAHGETRQLLFHTEGREVELRLAAMPGTDHWQLSGQVLGPDESGWACLSARGGYSAESTWSELAEFCFDDVPPGPCQVVIRGGDWELFLPDLQIPHDA